MKICRLIVLLLLAGCLNNYAVIKNYEVDKNDIIDSPLALFDAKTSYDGNGSILIHNNGNIKKIHLYSIENSNDLSNSDNSYLIYSLYAKTKDFYGYAFLEIRCAIDDKEFFSQGIYNKITDNIKWKRYKTDFIIKKNENLKKIELNLIINGKGKIWIDKIQLLKKELKQLNKKEVL